MKGSAARVLDALVGVFLFIWLAGGVPVGEKLWLRHGADPRRAALVLGLILFMVPALRQRSLVVAWTQKLVARLEHSSRLRWGVLGAVTLFASLVGIYQTLAMRYPLWDVGIYHQIVWNLSQGYGFGSTLSGAGDFLRDHLSVSLALLAPFMGLAGGSPLFLPAIQPVLVFGGVAAWLFLAERIAGNRSWLPAAVLVFGISFDSLWANFRWGPHESMIDFFALSWVFALLFESLHETAFLSSRGDSVTSARVDAVRGIALVLALIAAGTKETQLLNVSILLGIWSFYSFRKGLLGWSGLHLGFAVSMAVGFVYFAQMPHAPGKNYFERFYSYLGSNLHDAAFALLTSPWKVFQHVGVLELLKYALTIFLPFLFLPFLAGKRRWWLLVILPSIASAGLSTYRPLRQSGFHHVLELWPVLAALTILVLAARGSRKTAWIWAFCALLAMDQDPWNQLREYARDAWRVQESREAIAEIPPEHSLMADEMAGTWVSSRQVVGRWPEFQPFGGACPERVLLPVGNRELKDFPGAAEVLSRCSFAHVWNAGEWALFKLVKTGPPPWRSSRP